MMRPWRESGRSWQKSRLRSAELIWRESALEDLDKIVEYIAQLDFFAAESLQLRFEEYAERLTQHPYMFRTGRSAGTREAVVHPNYILVYRVNADAVEVVNVLHSRQQYPPQIG